MRRTADSDRLCIDGNKRDNNELAKALHAKKTDIARLEDELRELQIISDNQTDEITHCKAELDNKNHVNSALISDLARLEDTLADERATNAALRWDLAKATDVLRNKDADLLNKRDHLKELELQQADLTKLLASKDWEFTDRVKQLNDAEKELSALTNLFNRTCAENDHLDDQLKYQLCENDKLRKANVGEHARNDDHTGRLLSLEAQLREKDNHLAVLHKEADGLKDAFDRSQFIKDDLSEQLLAINKHISTLSDQNNRLSFELTDITERDAQIRAALDRRGRVKDINLHNDNEMQKSLTYINDVRNRSPWRRPK